MGGMQMLHVTLNHLDLFSYIVGFSSPAGPLELGGRKLGSEDRLQRRVCDPAAFKKKVRLLWIGIGTAEPERMRAGLHRLHPSLTEAGIEHGFSGSPGTDHEWQTWRRSLKEFAPRLFRKGGAPRVEPS